MNEQTDRLVRELAEKLGTTVEHLWEVLLKQAPISATMTAITAAVMVCIAWAALRFVMSKTTPPPKSDQYQHPVAQWENDGAFIAWLLLSCYSALTVAVVCWALTTAATALFNPEYWALQQLLQ